MPETRLVLGTKGLFITVVEDGKSKDRGLTGCCYLSEGRKQLRRSPLHKMLILYKGLSAWLTVLLTS